ncbi:uncharacterized protein LOC131936821 [Physella acuta]|uniref:uncharacterized protein LOC131936821 n=1 Tax=Physella acuta TaxID=109671 RepID=UPI0027DABD76|nr:uncharacterized protein LOC131936821 [Physella acuta]
MAMAYNALAIPNKDTALVPHDMSGVRTSNQDEFVLEQVLGLTSNSCHALSYNPSTGFVGFPAACILVLLDTKTNKQKFIESPSLRYISCVAFSEDGRFLAFGELGLKPYVSVWHAKEHKEYNKFIIDHSVGIKAIAFHPKSSFVVVLGTNDLNIGVWDFVRGRRLALSKWQTAPLALTIPKPGSYLVVCGHRKVTLFNFDSIQSNSYETNVFQDRKAVLLGRQSEYTFVDITSGKGKHEREVYTVTNCGFLCEIKMGDIIIDKATKVDTKAYCVRYNLERVFVGCCEGIVKICNPDTLSVEAAVSIRELLGAEMVPKFGSKLYADTTAMAINEKDSIVTCIYADCSMHSWQISGFKDSLVCTAIRPQYQYNQGDVRYESTIGDQIYNNSKLRSFLGCCDKTKRPKIVEPSGFGDKVKASSHGIRHFFKSSKIARNLHINAVKITPDGKDVVCGNQDGEIKVYDASTGVLRRVIEAHSSTVTCIELMYDEEYQLVCSGGRDRIIFVLNAKEDFSLVQVLCDHSAAITALSLVHNGGLLTMVSAAADNVILVRRAIPGNNLKFTITGEIAEARFNKSFNISSEYIVTGAGNGGIKVWKADPVFSGKPTKTIQCTQKCGGGNRAIGIDPSGSFLAITQAPGHITVYHLQTGQPVASLSSQSDVTAVKFTSDLMYIVSSTSDGCALVWRLPERMTEFMKLKVEKTYQIEMAREISYETYVSCLRVCQEMDDESPSQTGYLTESYREVGMTPSIESMNLLQLGSGYPNHNEHESLCGTESYLSCSTCQGSCSDTAYYYPSTDSSLHMQSAPFHFHDATKKIIEESKCTRLGMFKYTTNDDSDQPPMLNCKNDSAISAELQENTQIESLDKPTLLNHSKNHREVTNSRESEGRSFDTLTHITDLLDPLLSHIDGAPDRFNKLKDHQPVPKSDASPVRVSFGSPEAVLNMFSYSSAFSEGTYSTANSMFTMLSSETSPVRESRYFYSPVQESSVEVSPPHTTKYNTYTIGESPEKSAQNEQTFLTPNPIDSVPTKLHEDEKKNQEPVEDETSCNFRSIQQAYESELKCLDDDKSDMSIKVDSQQFEGQPPNDTAEVKLSRKIESSTGEKKQAQTNCIKLGVKEAGTNEHLKHESHLNKETKELLHPAAKSSNEGGQYLNSSDNKTELGKQNKLRPAILVPDGANQTADSLKNDAYSQKSKLFKDANSVFGYDYVKRDEEGRARWGNTAKDKNSSPKGQTSPRRMTSETDHCHEAEFDSKNHHWTITCSRCSSRASHTSTSGRSSMSQDVQVSETWDSCKQRLIGRAEEVDKDPSPRRGQGSNVAEKKRMLLGLKEEKVETEDEKLKVYYSELRQCLRLSNSQETFYRLKWDANDQELMELLAEALESRPTQVAEWFDYQKEACENEARVQPGASPVETTPEKKIIPTSEIKTELLEKVKNQGEVKNTVNFKETSSCSSPDVSEDSPKDILAIVQRILAARKTDMDKMSKNNSEQGATEPATKVTKKYGTRISSSRKEENQKFVHSEDNSEPTSSSAYDVPTSPDKSFTRKYLESRMNNRTAVANDPSDAVQEAERRKPAPSVAEPEKPAEFLSSASSSSKDSKNRARPIGVHVPEPAAAPPKPSQEPPLEASSCQDRKYTTPAIAELFRDQDDYLRKLKEVREKFEESIQALSNERKFRKSNQDGGFASKP